MAHFQQANSSQYTEIQKLQEQLDASQKKIDRFAYLIATLSDELDNLRNNICHTCKKKLLPAPEAVGAPSSTSSKTKLLPAPDAVVAPSSTLPKTSPAPLASTPLWRRVFQGRQHQSLPRLPVIDAAASASVPSPTVLSHNTSSPSTALAAPTSEPTTNPPVRILPATIPDSDDRTTTPSEGKSEPPPPEWSVVYNPDVKQALNIHVAHVFTYENPVSCAKISPDGQRLAIGLKNDGRTYIVEVKTRSNICVLFDLYIKDPLTIWSLQFSPDGQLVATAASDNRIRIWDFAQKRMRARFDGHANMINSIAFSPNGRFLVSASDDSSIRIWNMRDGASKKLIENANLFLPVTFSPDGKYIAAGSLDRSIRIWDARTHQLVAKWTRSADFPWCIEFTPDGRGLMIEGPNETLYLWDVTPLHQAQMKEVVILGAPTRFFEGHTAVIRSIGFLPDNDLWVVTCANDDKALLWDTATGIWQLRLEGHTDAVYAVDFSQTEKCLLTASLDRHATLWKYEIL